MWLFNYDANLEFIWERLSFSSLMSLNLFCSWILSSKTVTFCLTTKLTKVDLMTLRDTDSYPVLWFKKNHMYHEWYYSLILQFK